MTGQLKQITRAALDMANIDDINQS
jgi:hypothetical protein